MNLYATITSERASKAQGGNKEIDILLQVDPILRAQVGRLIMKVEENGYTIKYFPISGAAFRSTKGKNCIVLFDTTKGEKQKGEKVNCKLCSGALSDTVPNYCEKCEQYQQFLK